MAGVLCAMTETIDLVGTRPRLLIIRHLEQGPRGFNELKRLSGLSSRTLSLNLRFLEQQGIVSRSHAKYVLTASGKDLMPVLRDMGEWGMKWGLF